MISPSRVRFVALALCGAVSFSPVSAQQSGLTGDLGSGPIRKKLINLGWAMPSAEEFNANVKAINDSPFDGVAIRIGAKDDAGKQVPTWAISLNIPWKKEWFQSSIDLLKSSKSPKLAESFSSLSMSVAPQDFSDAFDDEAWKNIIEHYRIAAWVAKQSGLRGIMLDPEAYASTIVKFAARTNKDKTFDEYAAKVRQRGREMMEAMASEYPDMVLLVLFLNSGSALGEFGGDGRLTLESSKSSYALVPALVNGWLDVIPPQMTIVDGMEHSYPHSTEIAYLRRVNAARNGAITYVDKVNRAKFRSQVQAGLAVYLDAFVVDRTDVHSDVYIDPPLAEGESLADRLRQATMEALDAVDEYVWVYDENYRFWPTTNKRVQPYYWDEIIPGTTQALKDAVDPAKRRLAQAEREFRGYELKCLLRGRPLGNMLKDANVAPPAPKPKTADPVPAETPLWTAQSSTGVLERGLFGFKDPGCLVLKGTKEGAWGQEVTGHQLVFYKFRAKVRQIGKGEPEARLVWLDAEGKKIGVATATLKGSPKDLWATMETTVLSPAGTAKVAVQLGAKNQPSDKDQIWYDNPELNVISSN